MNATSLSLSLSFLFCLCLSFCNTTHAMHTPVKNAAQNNMGKIFQALSRSLYAPHNPPPMRALSSTPATREIVATPQAALLVASVCLGSMGHARLQSEKTSVLPA